MEWFYEQDGKAVGPVAEDALRELVRNGAVRPDCRVWCQAFGAEWRRAADAPELRVEADPNVEWFYESDGQSTGPVTAETLRELLRNNAIHPGCRVWQKEFGATWRRVAEVPEFQNETGAMPNADLHPGTPNVELMARARETLKGAWGYPILAVVINWLVGMGAGQFPFLGMIVALLIAGPLGYGLTLYFMNVTRRSNPQIVNLFAGFSSRFWTLVLAVALVHIFIFLWALLLIIPGIMAAYSYSMVYYVLVDNPQMTAMEALNRSKKIMRGYRWKFFCLMFRFIGWALLCILTCGIGFLWLIPYVEVAMANFYDSVKSRV